MTTHITQEQAWGLLLKTAPSGSLNKAALHALCNAAIQHYIYSQQAPSTAGEPTHQGENYEQQVRSQMDAVGGQQPMEGAGSGGNSNPAVLVSNIEALLALDAARALVPHGIGGHARSLLKSAAALLQSPALPDHIPDAGKMVAALPVGEPLTGEQIKDVFQSLRSFRSYACTAPQIEFARAILAAASSQPVREPLTPERLHAIWSSLGGFTVNHSFATIARAIEAAHGITKKGAP